MADYKDTPVLYKPEMVRAILKDLKTHTRRLNGLEAINEHPDTWTFIDFKRDLGYPASQGFLWAGFQHKSNTGSPVYMKCPYGGKGDRLWVRETWSVPEMYDSVKPSDLDPRVFNCIRYHADVVVSGGKTRVSIHMPRWASRINLEIVDIKVERIRDINPLAALAEGCRWEKGHGPSVNFKNLWNSINKARGYGWDKNPWVWVIEFKRLKVEA